MAGIHVVLAVSLACSFALATGEKRKDAGFELASAKYNTGKRICRVNVCFALDGSLGMPPASYEHQKQVIRSIVQGLSAGGGNIGLAAVQYGIINEDISPFTTNKYAFLSALSSSSQTKDDGTFTVAGLNYCFSELFDKPGRNKIVLFGSGKNTIGSDPGDRADLFFSTGGKICAVGVGPSQNFAALKEIAGGDPRRVFSIKNSYSISEVSEGLERILC